MSIGIVDGFEDIPIPQALTLRIQIFRFNASRFFPKNISTRNPTTSPHCYATILRHFLLNFPSNHLPLSYLISVSNLSRRSEKVRDNRHFVGG